MFLCHDGYVDGSNLFAIPQKYFSSFTILLTETILWKNFCLILVNVC